MNLNLVLRTLGLVLLCESLAMVPSLLVAVYLKENSIPAFLIAIFLLVRLVLFSQSFRLTRTR